MSSKPRRAAKPSRKAPQAEAQAPAERPRRLPIATLLGMRWDGNPREINDRDFEALKRSLQEFGMVEPVVVNARTNRIVGGHQRVAAADAVGIQDSPVEWVDLDEAKEAALNIALNKISGQFKWAELAALLKGMDDTHRLLTGFHDFELAPLIDGEFTPSDKGAVDELHRQAAQAQEFVVEFTAEQWKVIEDATKGLSGGPAVALVEICRSWKSANA